MSKSKTRRLVVSKRVASATRRDRPHDCHDEGGHSYETFLYGNVMFTFPDLAH